MVELPASTAPPRGRGTESHRNRRLTSALALAALIAAPVAPALADPERDHDRDRNADLRADRLVAQLTLDEKLQLVHGWGLCGIPIGGPTQGLHGAGFIPGIGDSRSDVAEDASRRLPLAGG
jgi:beta-glucosidase